MECKMPKKYTILHSTFSSREEEVYFFRLFDCVAEREKGLVVCGARQVSECVTELTLNARAQLIILIWFTADLNPLAGLLGAVVGLLRELHYNEARRGNWLVEIR